MRGRGEGSIFRRSQDGRWVAQIVIGWTPAGRPRYRRKTAKTRTGAVDALGDLMREARRVANLPDDISREPLDRYLDGWLAAIEPSVAARTYESYESAVRLHIKPAVGKVALGKLGPHHVQQMMTDVRGKGLTTMVGYSRTVLGAALEQAVGWGVLDRNVARMTRAPRAPQADVDALTVAQARQLLDALAGDRLYALYAVAVAIGLRISEALALRWDDIDLDTGVIRVRKQLGRTGEKGDRHYALVDLKRRKSRRDIPLPPFAVRLLADHKRRQAEERLAAGPAWVDGCCDGCGGTGWGLVFVTNTTRSVGRPLNRTWVLRHLQDAADDHDIDVTFHELRHTAATFLLAQGVPVTEVQDILGHSSITVTKDTYGHLELEHLRDAADKMDALLG